MLTDDELETYNDCWNEIQTKVVEMNAAFITGQADLEADWDTYIDDLYAMGLQDVIDVYQAALDRYNAR
jgi:putative aldouronate transport system substrate-binding protein